VRAKFDTKNHHFSQPISLRFKVGKIEFGRCRGFLAMEHGHLAFFGSV